MPGPATAVVWLSPQSTVQPVTLPALAPPAVRVAVTGWPAVAVVPPVGIIVRPNVGVTYVTLTGNVRLTRPLPNCPGVPPSSVTVSVGV